MIPFSRLLRPIAFVLILLPVPAMAQEYCTVGIASAVDAPKYASVGDPWIYRGTDIPIDEQWLFGEMPNGVRYAVRQNGVPPCQMSMRVRIDAGSLYEEDHERGFAHLIEHMLFRESRDFGPGEAIPHFQRMGAALGHDTNAMTTPTQTVYQLNLPNATRERMEESAHLFAGMIREPVLSADNLAADVPIVLAERRERLGAEMRVDLGLRELLYPGQLLASRAPIGTVETLEAATPEAVRAFHQRWYRPENTVVVMVGDAAPHVLAALVERHFGDWEAAGEHTDAPDFGDPLAPVGADPANPVGETGVMVEAGLPRSLTYAVLRPWEQIVDNMEYNRGLLIDSVALAIINRRLEERARAGADYLFAVIEQQDVSRSVDGTFVSLSPLSDDWQAALADAREVIADAMVRPPSGDEIEQAVATYEAIVVDRVSQERIQAGSQLADDLVGAVDIREAVASPQTFMAMFRSIRDRLTPENLLESTNRLFAGDVVRGMYLTPQLGEATSGQLREALARNIEVSTEAREEIASVSFADLPPIGTPGTVISRQPLGPGLVSTTEHLIFANGVHAMLRDSSNEPGRVTVRVRFGAGRRGFADDEAAYVELGEGALIGSGVGPLGQNELDRIAAGRKLSFDFSIGEGVFEFEGITRAEDVEEQLYLFAAKLANPRWDEGPMERYRASALLSYDAFSADPMSVLARDLDAVLRDGDPLFATATPAQLNAANAADFRRVWSRLLAQGQIEVSVFGDIDPVATVAALERTFGALPERENIPADVLARRLRFPSGNAAPRILYHDGEANQAVAMIAWPTSGGSDGLPQSRKLDLLAQLFANRLLDGLREEAGTSYTPYATSNWPIDLETGGYVMALAQVSPESVDAFFVEADRIALDLATNGPTDDELARVIEPVRQNIFRAQTAHGFWLNQVEGGTFDPMRVAHLPTLASDYIGTSRLEIQALAQRYLLGHEGLRLAVLPAQNDAP